MGWYCTSNAKAITDEAYAKLVNSQKSKVHAFITAKMALEIRGPLWVDMDY